MNLSKTLFADFLIYAYLCSIINQNHLIMHLYRFFNPSGYESDKYVVIVAATNVEALCAYVDRYHPNCKGYVLNKDFHRGNSVVMQVSVKQLSDGVVIFSNVFAIDIV